MIRLLAFMHEFMNIDDRDFAEQMAFALFQMEFTLELQAIGATGITMFPMRDMDGSFSFVVYYKYRNDVYRISTADLYTVTHPNVIGIFLTDVEYYGDVATYPEMLFQLQLGIGRLLHPEE